MPNVANQKTFLSQSPPASRLRLLVLAFDCHPTLPSLPAVSFKMCRELGRLADVTVVSRRQEDSFEVDGTDTRFLDMDYIKRPLDAVSEFLRGGNAVGWTTKTAFTYPTYLAFERSAWRHFGPALRAGEYDAVVRLSPMSPSLPSPMAKWSPVPFILGPINGGLLFPPELNSAGRLEREWLSPWRGLYRYLPFGRSSYESADVILAGFRHTLEGLPGDSSDRAINFPEIGFDPALFHPCEGSSTPGRIKFVFAGRLVPNKCADALVRAFGDSKELREHELSIIGDGPDFGLLGSLVSEYELEESVRLFGDRDQASVGRILRESQVFVFPSIRELGAGAVIEAMASGLPCVVFASGAPGDLVGSDRGLRIPLCPRAEIPSAFGAAMRRYVDEPGLLASTRAPALAYAQNYAWPRKAEHLLEVVSWSLGEREQKPEPFPL